MFESEILIPFLTAIEKFKARSAFCINGQFYTYADLAQSVSKIRASLKRSYRKNQIIGLIANDDIETYASIFALWLDGLSYAALDPQQPTTRLLDIISQAEIDVILNSRDGTVFKDIVVIKTSAITFKELDLHIKPTPEEDLAYILFTSGSTGKPKGVQITRKNLGAFMKSFWDTGVHINENDKCLQCFDLTFDVSVQSYLVPLTRGACTFTIPHDQIKWSYVYGLLEDHHLTFGAMVPSMIRYLRPYFNEINALSMRYNILTAEASPLDLVIEWAKCIPNAEIFDFYGPTETTIYCTYYKFNRASENKHFNGMLAIGKMMPGLNAIIIDENLKPLGANKKGELCICGDQLTPGYWKNPQKNKESFFTASFEGKQTRFYKTGDSCFMDDDGDIRIAGRLDYQVKIQGYRVELGEIEYHAREFTKGLNTIALAVENHSGNPEIVLLVEDTDNDSNAILRHLKSKLPLYMVPSRIIFITPFPLNPNGKTDRIKLKTLL